MISLDWQLQGKSNFISWTREFGRAAKSKDVLKLLKGEEAILDEPKEEGYLAEPGSGRVLRSRPPQLATPGGGDQQPPNIDTARLVLKWQADHKRWKRDKDKLRVASEHLDEWVCEGLKVELEEYDDSHERSPHS